MKTWKKISAVAISLVAILACLLYAGIVLTGKNFIAAQLKRSTGRQASVGHCDVSFPLNLVIRDINIPDLVRVEKVIVSPSILRIAFGRLAFNRVQIIRPRITIEKKLPPPESEGKEETIEAVAAGILDGAESGDQEESSAGGAELVPAEVKTKTPNLIFKLLTLEDGELEFIDQGVGDQGIKIEIKDINFELTNLYLPANRSAVTNFKLTGNMPWRIEEGQEVGTIKAEGWLNMGKRDIAAEVNVNDMDGIYLYPYYSNWVDLEKARIQEATLNFNSNIMGTNNNLVADCHLELANIVFKPREPKESKEKAEKIASTVIDIFKTMNQGKIMLDFTIKTKMDRPEFGFGDIRMAFEEKLNEGAASRVGAEDIFMFPARLWEGAVRTTVDISKSVIKGTSNVGNQVGDFVAEAYKKVTQPEPVSDDD